MYPWRFDDDTPFADDFLVALGMTSIASLRIVTIELSFAF